MTIKTTAIAIAIILTATASAQANRVDSFCGDRYCGHVEENSRQVYKTYRHKSHQPVAHKEKRAKSVKVASIGNEPIQVSGLASQAEAYLGQTAREVGVRSTLWCSAFIRKLTGASGVDDRAISWLNKPRASHGCINCIAVMRHHVGIVKSYDGRGNPILVSGNHRHRVGVSAYPRGRIIAYVSL